MSRSPTRAGTRSSASSAAVPYACVRTAPRSSNARRRLAVPVGSRNECATTLDAMFIIGSPGPAEQREGFRYRIRRRPQPKVMPQRLENGLRGHRQSLCVLALVIGPPFCSPRSTALPKSAVCDHTERHRRHRDQPGTASHRAGLFPSQLCRFAGLFLVTLRHRCARGQRTARPRPAVLIPDGQLGGAVLDCLVAADLACRKRLHPDLLRRPDDRCHDAWRTHPGRLGKPLHYTVVVAARCAIAQHGAGAAPHGAPRDWMALLAFAMRLSGSCRRRWPSRSYPAPSRCSTPTWPY